MDAGAPPVDDTSNAASASDQVAAEEPQGPQADPRYPLKVQYCSVCTLPAEVHEYHSRNQFQKYASLLSLGFCFGTSVMMNFCRR